jgi:hypothetical protein
VTSARQGITLTFLDICGTFSCGQSGGNVEDARKPFFCSICDPRAPFDSRRLEGAVIIAVLDGMGGGIGAQIVSQLREELPLEAEILALGANAVATQKMMQARASRGASGENAIRVSIGQADFILAPIGVVIPNSMMGEITPIIAAAVAGAPGRKLLLPINQPYFEIVGIEWKALTKQISAAIETIQQAIAASG